ncbi:dihydrofolate reductase family protein [Nonomuraea gerenzanensis]|uniref:Dihydrofolate reductase n=1 Tax=Nonomuraea gerenzanensis TaxID=93944 RepID=A0A1M4ED99_9ACTN|nr:dihydrofolate reductase family protein [Nonomuraea gerenzanensis]UBU18693.1 dihydrofolate reductase family protein [Nonomuraea gerenzanensis]SBO96553.1 Dihydrofolate reductase [Nonomuraea gerenzanensis]
MRKIVAGLFISLDGVVEAPETWHFPYLDEEMRQAVAAQLAAADALLLGRRTYDVFAAHWPHQDAGQDPMAATLNAAPKYVVSTTLTDPAWANTTVIAADPRKELLRLKESPGGDIGMSGSPTLVTWLLREGLLDELNLLVHPLVVGTGRRLFEPGSARIPLTLTESATFGTGVLNLTYTRA